MPSTLITKIPSKKNHFIDNHLTDTHFIKNLLGDSRHRCTQSLSDLDIDSIDFGHWLAIPSQQLLLIFRHQQCVAIDCYQTMA